MNIQDFKACFARAFDRLQGQVDYLSSLDAQTGDGDHGVTIGKIAAVVSSVMGDERERSLSELFEYLSAELMSVNGGAAVPLWAMMAGGIGEALEGVGGELTGETVGRAFAGACAGLREISTAKPGEKTLLDALLPASEAAQSSAGSGVRETLRSAAEAAAAGAESTKDMIARFGRAKALHEKSLGFYDPGSVSMSLIIKYLYEEAERAGA